MSNAVVKPEMQAMELIDKTREYLDYVERHIKNIRKAWVEIQEKCTTQFFIYDDFLFWSLNSEVMSHDVSKLSEHEFIQYRKSFYPAQSELDHEPKYDISKAWDHHKESNPHHWETWTKLKDSYPNESHVNCVHMVIDWIAMSYEFGDTPRAYYEKNKERIDIPDHAVRVINEIFDCLEST